MAGRHQLVTAVFTPKPKIHTDAQNQEFFSAAGMGLFHP
jgi:hypothetical protein